MPLFGGTTFDATIAVGDLAKRSGTSTLGKVTAVPGVLITSDVGTTENFYVATTGSDAADGSILTPWLTIQHALNHIASNISSGKIIIHVADGTYTEELVVYSFFGAVGAAENILHGPVVVEILGNTTTPANVIVSGSGIAEATFNHYGTTVTLVVNGVTVNNVSGYAAFKLYNSLCYFKNGNVNAGLVVDLEGKSTFQWRDSTTGGTFNCDTAGFSTGEGSTVIESPFTLNLSGTAYAAFFTYSGGSTYVGSPNIICNGVASAAVAQTDENASLIFQCGDQFVANSFGAGFQTIRGSFVRAWNGSIIQLNNCGSFHEIHEACWVEDDGTVSWTRNGTTPNTYTIAPSAQAISTTGLSGATAVAVESSVNNYYGNDFRYVKQAPTATNYTPASGSQTVTIDCSKGNMHTVVGNASGTAITFAITGDTHSQPFIISILQGSGTVSTIAAWFSTVRWAGGVAPTLTATLNKRDTFGFIRTGTNTYDGFIIGQNC